MFSPLNIKVGWYLAVRQIRRSSMWTNTLIVSVMLLTFLNLVVVTGFLVGIVDGISNMYREKETGDVVISSLPNKNYIENSQQVIAFLKKFPQVESMTYRYSGGGTIEANYKTRTNQNEKPNQTGATIAGIDPEIEDAFSHLSEDVGEGAYLGPGDYDQVLIGSLLIDRYSFGDAPGISPLRDVYPGTKVRLTINGNTREVIVKGILTGSANSPTSQQVYMLGSELAQLLGRTDYNVSQIAMFLAPGTDPVVFRDLLKRSGISDVAKVQTFEDAIPNGVAEIKNTFAMIGNAMGSVGLIVASITIFIVIFINAITRRKYIGILKGIGIDGKAIEIAYIFQSLFYALIGAGLGAALLYGFLVPYFNAHPIPLPISDVIIVAPPQGTAIRIGIMILATVIAGYIPARMIVKKNTLDSILGRN